jgi:hypothetical protein
VVYYRSCSECHGEATTISSAPIPTVTWHFVECHFTEWYMQKIPIVYSPMQPSEVGTRVRYYYYYYYYYYY